jgi:hypothetical protein
MKLFECILYQKDGSFQNTENRCISCKYITNSILQFDVLCFLKSMVCLSQNNLIIYDNFYQNIILVTTYCY